jgi:hypothetical protein
MDHMGYLRRFLAAGGTQEQFDDFAQRYGDAVRFGSIVGGDAPAVGVGGGGMPVEAAAVLIEWSEGLRRQGGQAAERLQVITYRGDPALASALVQMLEEREVQVRWERPEETRGLQQAEQDYLVTIAAMGTPAAIAAAVKAFRKWSPRARVDFENDDDE